MFYIKQTVRLVTKNWENPLLLFDLYTLKTLALLMLSAFAAHAQMHVVTVNDTLTPAVLVKKYFLGQNMTVSNVQYQGDPEAIGLFEDYRRAMGFERGIIISNGRADILPGKNSRPNTGANFGRHYFFDPDFITRSTMCDGAVLEFDFIPQYDSITFRFVFGSEEYPEFVGKNFNDAFALLISPNTGKHTKPQNIGTLPNKTTVMINNVNHKTNSEWYVANDYYEAPFYDYLEYDGFTKPIVAAAKVVANKPYHIKILIADLEDCEYDSGVLLEALSFSSQSTKKPRPVRRQYYFNFATDSYALNKTEQGKVNRLADSVSKFAFDSIIVIGHTDSSGDEQHNLQLSQQRAETIAAALGQKFAKPPVIRSVGAGSSKPVQSNNTEKGKAANRRVEILFYKKRK
jgi:outer membrane protein OmpA-like peptidoglycan-associated protein